MIKSEVGEEIRETCYRVKIRSVNQEVSCFYDANCTKGPNTTGSGKNDPQMALE